MPFNPTDSNGNVTQYGLVPLDADEILRTLNENVLINLATLTGDSTITIDTSDQSVVGRLNEIFANRMADMWSQAVEIQSSFYTEEATGVSLAKLALLIGFLRNPSTSTKGELRFKGDDGTLIPTGSLFASLRGDQYTNDDIFTISLEECLSLEAQVNKVIANREYQITINSTDYVITSSASPTAYSILSSLSSSLSADDTVTTELSSDLGDDSWLRITKISQTTTMSCIVSALLTPRLVEVEKPISSVNTGIIFGDADTINEIVTPVSGLEEINNPADFLIGSEQETDDELRERMRSSFNTAGSGTYDSILTIINREELVISATVEENRLFETNTDGVPPKSFEVIVYHLTEDQGSLQSIAQSIWDIKPAGIATHGSDSYEVTDSRGNPQTVEYTLATPYEVYVLVEYTLLPESEGETPPEGLEGIIQEVITLEGNEYPIGRDVIGKRFFSPVFENTEGVETLNILVSATQPVDPTDPSEYSARIAINREEIARFSTQRVTVVEL